MKYEMLKKRVDIVKKVVEENDLELGITDNELVKLFNDEREIITSSDLKIGDSKNIIFCEMFNNVDDTRVMNLIESCVQKNTIFNLKF